MAKAFIFLAEGFEDIEALATADVLRRGGVEVELISISEDPFVVSSHGVTVGTDSTLAYGVDIEKDDVMIFPGGMPGTRNLAACEPLIDCMKDHYADGGTVAAICAAPGLVLGQIDDLSGVRFTCFDSFENLPQSKGAEFVKKPALTCGNVITGRSAGYAVAFGLEILKAMKGSAKAEEVAGSVSLACE